MASPELISAVAAVVSAVGGAFAAVAAFRSAASAREAQDSAEEAQRRVALREVVATAAQVSIENQRAQGRIQELTLAYNSLSVFSGSSENSGIQLAEASATAKANRALQLLEYSKLFAAGAASLEFAPSADIDRVQVRLSSGLLEVRAIREDLEREHSFIERQCAEHRESRSMSRSGR